jgi:hypothetical protein
MRCVNVCVCGGGGACAGRAGGRRTKHWSSVPVPEEDGAAKGRGVVRGGSKVGPCAREGQSSRDALRIEAVVPL